MTRSSLVTVIAAMLLTGCSAYIMDDRRKHPGTAHPLDSAAPIVDVACTAGASIAAVYMHRYEQPMRPDGNNETFTAVFVAAAVGCGISAIVGFGSLSAPSAPVQ